MRIKLAEFIIDIGDVGKYTSDMCRDYEYIGEKNSDFSVTAEKGLIDTEKKRYPDAPEDYLENICIYRCICKKIVAFGGILIHSAAIGMDGNGYMFSASRGTGKTTHMNLWLNLFPGRAFVINGDKPIVREIDGQFFVFGTPWCGKEGINTNTSAPIKGICILKRAENNSIERTPSAEALAHLLTQTVEPEKGTGTIAFLDILDRLIKNVPIYTLHCNMNPEAAEVAYNGMCKK